MDVGAIGFHDKKKVKSVRIEKDKSVVNALNKTKEVYFIKYHYYSNQLFLVN
jgi:hypothetical protein